MLHRSESKFLFYAILVSEIVKLLPFVLSLFGVSDSSVFISLIRYVLMIIASFYLLKYVLNNHLKISFLQKLFIIWIVYLYLTAIPDIVNPYKNHLYFKQFLLSFMFLYLIPLMMIAELDIEFLKRLFKFCYFLAVAYIVVVILFAKYDDEGCTLFAEGVIILMMTWPYHKPKQRIVVILVFVIAIVGMMLAARRNKVVFFGGGLLFALIINIISSSSYGASRKVFLVLLLLAFGVGLYFNMSSFGLFFERMHTGMESREGIIELFVDDFNSHPSDWVYGRGIYGEFDGGALNTKDELGLRDGIENGYLQLILKGGGIWLGLLTIIALNAVYKGLFKSKNLLCKGFAMIILLYYLDMIGFGIPTVSLKYFMVFLAIAGCNTTWLLECSDDYLAKEIGLK